MAEVQRDYVYGSLRGREPHGIVELDGCDKVVVLAFKREKAGFMGLVFFLEAFREKWTMSEVKLEGETNKRSN